MVQRATNNADLDITPAFSSQNKHKSPDVHGDNGALPCAIRVWDYIFLAQCS